MSGQAPAPTCTLCHQQHDPLEHVVSARLVHGFRDERDMMRYLAEGVLCTACRTVHSRGDPECGTAVQGGLFDA